ncbi:aminoglycoside phosphotransferase family protein [Microbacterium keratanolyticum]|uniref:aminoglycoside phosphotransferase family protein n=1 Tax=Microbacterium keratanolyticum TaxID=67574 RepID=UPI003638DF01
MTTHTHELTFTATEARKRYRTWSDREPEREWVCLTVLAEHAPGLAPRPLRRETADGAPAIVMERLAGEPLGAAPLNGAQTASLGRALRRLYSVPLSAAQALDLGERRLGPSSFGTELRQWANGPYDLKECQNPQLVERALRASRQWLADTPQVPAQLSVLGIADLNPANVLWDGSVCRLVDFEDGGLSELAFELADHVEHLAGRDVYDADTLVDAVGLTKDEKERFTHWRCHWAIFWLLMLLPGNGGFLRNPAGTTEAQAARALRMLADEPSQTPAGTAETV